MLGLDPIKYFECRRVEDEVDERVLRYSEHWYGYCAECLQAGLALRGCRS